MKGSDAQKGHELLRLLEVEGSSCCYCFWIRVCITVIVSLSALLIIDSNRWENANPVNWVNRLQCSLFLIDPFNELPIGFYYLRCNETLLLSLRVHLIRICEDLKKAWSRQEIVIINVAL